MPPIITLRRVKFMGTVSPYICAATIAGGFQVPSPAGRIEGISVFGQFSATYSARPRS
ncbi:hypothetical protein IVB46_36245 [Bradyrhizobium sp. 61]|uniref:hypothetical protein n=1 Tax=unclassified Bradyrhizobium TaxID=2631580 RepID=UPI001FFAE7B0|nr:MULTISPECIES: hypothetical protein [unclassified Bradyrhizobium]MCK1280689.1 hypothetical protein [Bradyrhizobium sp. 61]MCK1465386.1 hypothetical protein [Bradyrhizobium sp. 2]